MKFSAKVLETPSVPPWHQSLCEVFFKYFFSALTDGLTAAVSEVELLCGASSPETPSLLKRLTVAEAISESVFHMSPPLVYCFSHMFIAFSDMLSAFGAVG